MSPVLYKFLSTDGSQFILGVPGRDVTLADWDQLEDQAKKDLQAHAKASDGLYTQVMTVADARKAEGSGDAKPQARKKAAKKGEQADPNAITTGRVDADVVATGLAVPSTDEPIGEGAAGFVKADTGPANVQEG